MIPKDEIKFKQQKENIKKNFTDTDNKGITLVALVVTIIVLLILAGVSLSAVLSQDGIFHRAEQGIDKYGQSKARETLELALGEAQMKKYEEGLTEEQLDEQIKKVGSLIPKEDENSNNQLVIVDGHIFEIDRSVPKIIDYKGPADGIIITATISQNGNWTNPSATVTGTITKYGGETVISSSATAKVVSTGTTSTVESFPTTGGSYTISNITTDTDITITAQDSEGHEPVTEVIKVRLVRDNTPPTISEEKAITDNELNIKISAKATDSESGVASFKYKITPTTGLSVTTGDLPQNGEEVTVTSTKEETYTITITATDKAGKTATKEITGVKTRDGGVIKHIKLSDGTLKEVNTKDIYGATVNGYSCTRTGVEWQIFYIDEADNNRVYLISKDYVVPPVNSSTVTPKLLASNDSSHPKAFRFGTSTSDQSVLGSFTGNLVSTSATYNKFINDYLKDYSSGLNASSSQPNLQATKLMLEQTYWAEYNGAKADLAFGGATLPLFQASYNDICRTATKLGIQKSGTGYQYSLGGGSYSECLSGYGNKQTQKGIYFYGNDSNSAYGMWLASPGVHSKDTLSIAYYGGNLCSHNSFNSTLLGFRPIVSLKTNVTFTSNTDGTVYTIAN